MGKFAFALTEAELNDLVGFYEQRGYRAHGKPIRKEVQTGHGLEYFLIQRLKRKGLFETLGDMFNPNKKQNE